MNIASPSTAVYYPDGGNSSPSRRFSVSRKRIPREIINSKRNQKNDEAISDVTRKDGTITTITKSAALGLVPDTVIKQPNYLKTTVSIRKNREASFQRADFSICLFDYFGIDDDHGLIECTIRDNVVYLQPPEKPQSSVVKGFANNHWQHVYELEHPAFCAVHRLSEDQRQMLSKEISERGVDVGVSVLLESSDRKILTTRRASHMRTFPDIWVLPGGHMEEGESFEEAGLREVREETGLNPQDVKCRLLGLWESCYPPVLYEGQPVRHHLVVYLGVVLPQHSEQLQQLIKLDPSEVGASMWISEDVVAMVVEGILGHSLKSLKIPITIVNQDGSQFESLLDPKVLRKKMPAPGRIVERLSTGTRFALKLWLQQKRRMS